jgi:glycosyltransferase involved in cell wall biosynthesis
MRIVHIASGDLWGGAETQLYSLCEESKQLRNLELTVVLFNYGLLETRLREGGIPVEVFDEQSYSSINIFWKILSYLRRTKPEIVHTHGQKANVLGSVATLGAPAAISVRTVHGASEFRVSPWQVHKHSFRVMDRLCGRYLQERLVAVTESLADELAKTYPRSSICVIENGLAVGTLDARLAQTIKLPGPRNSVKIALVGRLVPVKRVDIMLKTAQYLGEAIETPVFFYVFGAGPLQHELEELAKRLKVQDRVFFMGFKIDVFHYLRAMDMLIVTSDHEGLPMVVLEALLLEVPVVASAVGGIPKLLGGGDFGTLVYTQDPAHYANAISRGLECVADVQQKARAGRRHTETKYSAATKALEYRNLYADLISRGVR